MFVYRLAGALLFLGALCSLFDAGKDRDSPTFTSLALVLPSNGELLCLFFAYKKSFLFGQKPV
jgi:hypothetical protein